jgi:hypothetical protein
MGLSEGSTVPSSDHAPSAPPPQSFALPDQAANQNAAIAFQPNATEMSSEVNPSASDENQTIAEQPTTVNRETAIAGSADATQSPSTAQPTPSILSTPASQIPNPPNIFGSFATPSSQEAATPSPAGSTRKVSSTPSRRRKTYEKGTIADRATKAGRPHERLGQLLG